MKFKDYLEEKMKLDPNTKKMVDTAHKIMLKKIKEYVNSGKVEDDEYPDFEVKVNGLQNLSYDNKIKLEVELTRRLSKDKDSININTIGEKDKIKFGIDLHINKY